MYKEFPLLILFGQKGSGKSTLAKSLMAMFGIGLESSPDELFPRSEEVAMIRPTVYLTKPLDFARFLETVHRLAPRAARV